MIVESNRRGLLPQQFIADAVREMIARTPGASPADAKASKFTHLVIDLEHYADKSRYLTSSLLDSLEYWREHGEPSEDCFGSLLCGCSLIVEDLNDSLSQIITGLLQNIPKRIDDQVTGQGTSPSAA